MAFDAGSLLSFLRLDTKGFSTGLTTAKGKVNQFDTSLAKSDKTLKGMSGTAAGLGKLMLTGLGFFAAFKAVTAFTGAVSDSIGMAADLEKSMANVATLVDTAVVNIDGLTESVIEMTSEVLKSADDLSAGLYQVFSAGVTDSAEAMEVLRVSAIAATAGLSDTRTSVDAITTILNAYGLEANRATDVSDLLFQTVKLGKTTFSELANAIGTVISPAAAVGIELDELFAVLATLTKGGIDTRTSTTALRAVLLSVLKPTDQAKKKAKELGLEWNVQALRAKQLIAFLGELREKTKGNAEDITEIVPNVRALNAVLATVGQQWEELNEIQDQFADRAGASAGAFEKQADTVVGQSERMSLAFEKLQARFGRLFLPVELAAIRKLADLFERLAFLSERIELKRLRNEMQGLNETIQILVDLRGREGFFGPSEEEIGKLDIRIKNLSNDYQVMQNRAILLINVMDNSKKSFNAVQTSIEGVNEEIKKVISGPELFQDLEPFSQVLESLPSVFDNLIKSNDEAADRILKTWEQTSDGIKEAFKDLGIVPEFQFEQVVQDTLSSFETVTTALDERGDLTVEKAAKIRQALIDKLKEISAEAAESGFIIDEEQVARIEQLLSELGESALTTSSRVISDTENLADATTVTIKKGVFDVDNFITDTATQSINSFRDVGLNVTSELINDFAVMADSHVEEWRFATDQLKELDISYTDSFQTELDKREDGFTEFTRSLQRQAIDTANSINALLEGTVTPSITVPVFDRGSLSVPNTGLAQVEQGEMIIPAAQNPFNDNRTFNNNFEFNTPVEDEFMQKQALSRFLDQNRERVSI